MEEKLLKYLNLILALVLVESVLSLIAWFLK